MLVMSLVVLTALAVVALLSLSFAGRASTRRAEAARDVENEVALIQKRAHEANHKLAAAIVAGVGVDVAVAQFQKERAALLPAGRTEDAWAWTADDLDAYRKAELRRRSEEIGRRLLLPAVGSVLAVVLAAAGALVLLYPHSGLQSELTPDGSVPSGAPEAPSLPLPSIDPSH